GAWAAAGDHQVAAVLEEEGGQRRIVLFFRSENAVISGQLFFRLWTKIDRHAAKQVLVVGQMTLLQFIERLAREFGCIVFAVGYGVGGDVSEVLVVRRGG